MATSRPSVSRAIRSRWPRMGSSTFVLVGVLVGLAGQVATVAALDDPSGDQHLLISEVVTGGASASDELIELYNPGPAALPLEGLEVVYLSAAGTLPSRRVAWEAGAPSVAAGAHVLLANSAGVFAPIADAVFTSAIAATGGSVALRIQGASSAIDAVGWGSATTPWMESPPAPAPEAGTSLERLPGSAAGSGQDTDHNATDFVLRPVPDPQNSTSPPVPDPGASASPIAPPSSSPWPSPSPAPSDPPTSPSPPATPSASATDATPDPSLAPSAAPSALPSDSTVIPIADARTRPDGGVVTVEGVALTTSDFTDGGGFVADASGGIAVLLADRSFVRGDRVRVTGPVSDRFSQRTIRLGSAGLEVVGAGESGPEPIDGQTGSVNEQLEGRLVHVAGELVAGPVALSDGVAFDLDDGSGIVRVIVGNATGISTSGWLRGARVELAGVAGQRDSTGSGAAGYRVLPRDANDVRGVVPPSATPSSAASAGSPGPTASPGGSASALVAIADARAASTGEQLRVRGVVTLGRGHVEPASAVIQDSTAGILLRLDAAAEAAAGVLARGALVEVAGTRSTYAGMASLRVSQPPERLGTGAEPSPLARETGGVGEVDEAQLRSVRGGLVASPRRSSSGTVSFEVDDGSGPLRVAVHGAAAADADALARGTWVSVTGVVGQETTGSQPLAGYRLWPRVASDLAVLAAPPSSAGSRSTSSTRGAGGSGSGGASSAAGTAGTAGLEALLDAGATARDAHATLVAGAWPRLALAGLLWDGHHLVGVVDDANGRDAVAQVAGAGLPAQVVIRGAELAASGGALPFVAVAVPADGLKAAEGSLHPPLARLPSAAPPAAPAWVRVGGRLIPQSAGSPNARLNIGGAAISLEVHCDRSALPTEPRSIIVTGIGLAEPARVLLGCDGVRRAPALAAAMLAAAADPIGDVPETPDEVDDPAPRLTAMVLLATATLATAASAWLAWRRRDEWLPALLGSVRAGPSDATTSPEGSDGGDAPAEERPLVELPRERGFR